MWGVVRWHQLMSGGSKGSMCTTFHPQPGLSSQKEEEDAELAFNMAMDIIDSYFLWHCLLLRNSDMLDLCGCQLQFLNLDFYQKFPVLTETDIRKESLSNNGRFSIWLPSPKCGFLYSWMQGIPGLLIFNWTLSSFNLPVMILHDLSQPYIANLTLIAFQHRSLSLICLVSLLNLLHVIDNFLVFGKFYPAASLSQFSYPSWGLLCFITLFECSLELLSAALCSSYLLGFYLGSLKEM